MQTQENNKKRQGTKRTRLSLGIQLAVIALVADAATISAVLAAPAASANHAPATDLYTFNVPTLALDEALVLLARQAGVELYLGSNDLTKSYGNPVKGRLSLDAALQTLLANQGVSYSLTGSAERPIIQVQSMPNSAGIQAGDLHPTYIMGMEGKQSRDEKGYNDIYDQDISSVYAGKEQIERYKGAAPADMFKGMLNVYSGDSRNSGALDPNIRDIQGPGRVPVTIDGTEQAITAYRGYMGANNRNYIDPNLIGSIKVLKGPNLERNVYSGVGGGSGSQHPERRRHTQGRPGVRWRTQDRRQQQFGVAQAADAADRADAQSRLSAHSPPLLLRSFAVQTSAHEQ